VPSNYPFRSADAYTYCILGVCQGLPSLIWIREASFSMSSLIRKRAVRAEPYNNNTAIESPCGRLEFDPV
jgi:hypothetical protein